MSWPDLKDDHPLLRLHAKLPQILEEAAHDRIWGLTLSAESPPAFSTLLVLQKYLRSVSDDVEQAATALARTLKWRKEFGLDGAGLQAGTGKTEEEYGPDFDGLGYVTIVKHNGKAEIVTWNVYGAVKSLKSTFGDLDRFLRWRVALMERAISHLHLESTTMPIPDYCSNTVDPHRIAQVHLYEGVSFLRMDPHVKAASKATIEIMSAHYPEMLSRKFFVGVPLIMSWMFTAMKLIISAETAKKFVVISYKENLAAELGDAEGVPAEYGGKGPDLKHLENVLESRDA
ncbi:phosphatidylinositol transfer protein SFH5 [Kwoniella heveanensis BCC8398]|uniref:Phosphatidylinositol transfer protein SFH5 n=1 Tax=Kwoniella heveanensis BCC8398 TaxID=1296120 RepID=A0A1B9GYB9_9TREE|nr:phosphatidylinositol transfer protein SFH5 [Kwoniella heveanensis BCC8398]